MIFKNGFPKKNSEAGAKRFKKRFLLIPVALVLIAAVVVTQVLPALRRGTSFESTVDEKVLTESVSKGSIDTVLSTAGSITDSDSVKIEVPDSVTITSYAVQNGQSVKEGDVIAYVDKSSALLSIIQIQDKMDELDAELEEAKEDSTESSVTAPAAGKIKAVWAQEGDKVIDVMYENGALVLISLDGQMAVEIETDSSISVGDTVKVKTSDGETYKGKVAERSTDTAVITVSDEKTTYGDKVTVTTKKGKELGSGKLYVHSEQKIVGYSGSVKSVKVSVDDKVDADDTILTLNDSAYLATYQALLAQRHVLEETVKDLFQMYQTGTVTAKSDGLISNLDKDLLEDVASSNKTYTANNMVASNAPASTEETVYDFAAKIVSVGNGSLTIKVSSDSISLSDYTNISGVSTSNLTKSTTLTVPSSAGIYKYSGGSWSNLSLSSLQANQKIICSFESSGNLLWIVAGNVEASEEESKEEESSATNPSESQGSQESKPSESQGSQESKPSESQGSQESQPAGSDQPGQSGQGTDPTGGNGQQPGQGGDYTGGTGDQPGQNGQGTDPTGSNGQQPGQSGDYTGGNGEIPSQNGNGSTGGMDFSGLTGNGLSGSGSMSGLSGMSGMSGDLAQAAANESAAEEAAAEKAASKYGVDEDTVCSVIAPDHVTIDVTVDELDILSLSVGDEATITLDALKNQEFTGKITKINPNGTNDGGNTKYTVSVQMDRSESMLSGMNATVNFLQDTASDVLMIPAAAINEKGNSVFVYTSYNEKEDELGDPVEVTTGVTDGSNVEIIDGLNEGDTYYYKYADSITWSFQK